MSIKSAKPRLFTQIVHAYTGQLRIPMKTQWEQNNRLVSILSEIMKSVV